MTLLGLSVALVLVALPHVAHSQPPTPAPAPPFDPYLRADAELLLPILDFQGADDVCESWIDVQNLGADAAKVALATWGEPGFCPPQSAGPLRSYCSPILRPGGVWTFGGWWVPTGSQSGVLFRLSAAPFPRPSGVASEDRDDTSMADIACREAFWYLGLADEGATRLVNAYRRGLLFDGIDFGPAAGTGQLAATVTRRCPSYRTRGADTVARYNAIALNRVGDADPAQGGYVVFAPAAHVVTGGDGAPGVDGGTTILYVQNAGLKCASIDIWFAAHDGCGSGRLCDSLYLASLETYHIDTADCGPPNAKGALWVRSTQPVAVVAERILGDERSTYTGIPSTLQAAFDPAREAPRPTGPTISVPYVSNGDGDGNGSGDGGDEGDVASHVAVLNAHPSASARIRLSLLDPSGAVRTSLTDWLCPRGSASYDLAAIGDLPADWHGAARIVALDSVLDGASDGTLDGTASPDGQAMLVGGVPTSGLIALPSIQRALDGRTSTIVVHNAVAVPGFTALRTDIFDANGLVNFHCDRLAAGEQRSIDLDAHAYLGSGFRGAAIVSAVYWDHGRTVAEGGDRVVSVGGDGDGDGDAANPVGLTALTLVRSDGQGEEPGGGQGVAVFDGPIGAAGIPLRGRDIVVGAGGASWLVAGLCDGEIAEVRPGAGVDARPAHAAHAAYAAHAAHDEASFDAHRRGGAEILLPILNDQGADEVCESAIDVQNLGAEVAKAALVTWGPPGFCRPQSAGPLKVECTGLIRPGAVWRLFGAQIPTGSRGGTLFRLSDEPHELDGIDVGECCLYGDYVCEKLFFNVVGDADDSRRFTKAYRQGLMFDDIDMVKAAGTGMLAATVTRTCADRLDPDRPVVASYNGIAANQLGDVDPAQGGFVVFAPDVHVASGSLSPVGGDEMDAADESTILYVQNAGLDCASVELWFGARDGCGDARLCAVRDIAQGETAHFDAAECAPLGAEAAMWVRSTQPVAVVAERPQAGALATYTGFPSSLAINVDGRMPAPRPIGSALSAPFALNDALDALGAFDGLHTSIVVQNLSATASTRVRVAFIDPNGIERAALVDWLCPRGRGVYDAAAVRALPTGWTGSVRVVGGDGANGGPSLLGGVARLVDVYGRVHSAHAMPAASAGPGNAVRGGLRDDHAGSGAGVVAIPALPGVDYPQAVREDAELVIANTVATSGFTEVATFVYDANGLVDERCGYLMQGEQLKYDTATWAPAMRFRGAAIVSAWRWEHDAFDLRGSFVGNQVGIAAAVVSAGGDLRAEPPGSDAVRPGVPFRWTDAVVPAPSGPARDLPWIAWPDCPPAPFR